MTCATPDPIRRLGWRWLPGAKGYVHPCGLQLVCERERWKCWDRELKHWETTEAGVVRTWGTARLAAEALRTVTRTWRPVVKGQLVTEAQCRALVYLKGRRTKWARVGRRPLTPKTVEALERRGLVELKPAALLSWWVALTVTKAELRRAGL